LEQSIKIRQFISSDMEKIEEIEKDCVSYVTPFSFLSLYYEIIPECFLVAEADGKVVGYVISNLRKTREVNEEGHILSIAVDPSYRRRKIGNTLINQIINVFKNKGVKRLSLEVKANNIAAQKFYLSLGFEEVQVLKRYYRMRGYTEDAVLMVKRIE